MDLSLVGFEGLASTDPNFASSDHENKHKLYGSDLRSLKMAKTEDYYSSVSYNNNNNNSINNSNKQMLRSSSGDGQQMLSFSVTDSKNGGFNLYNNGSSGYYANTGYGYGASVRGPFTPSQWMELEHQALIYKYILANVSVPSNLLIPIKKALDSAAFSVGPLRPTSYGWGGFHLGFSTNTDPEPGRCRRTDGKKWRCSRDAVADQKYCERHINRGRHRSRKPVEGLNASTNTTNTAATNAASATSAKLVQAAAVSSPAAAVPGGAGIGVSHQLKSLQTSGGNTSDSSVRMNGIFLNNNNNLSPRNQATTDLSMFSSGINSKNTQFSVEKPQNEFGLVFSSSLLNPIQEQPPSSTHHHFIDEWPKDRLSISIPISTSEFTSSTSSPTEEKLASSPLRLSSNWVPLSWEGPLGEVLHNTNQLSSNEFKLSSGSPNGPFQRMGFGSQSNSSAGSSPRGVATSLTPLL